MAGGRPRKEFDWDKLNAILQYGAKLVDAADIMDVHPCTVSEKIKTKFKMSFPEYRDKKMSKVRVGLAQKQVEVAMSGNVTMLIWLGKQWLEQTDKQELSGDDKGISINYNVIKKKDV